MSVKDKTLNILEINKGNYISSTELAKKLFVSRNTIGKSIKSLQAEGYNICAITNKRYCLDTDTDILSSQSISKYLDKNSNNFNIKVYKKINSTNTAVKELALNGEKEGIIIIAEEQTEGRGRFGKKFYSPKGTGIYMSILLKPQIHISKSFLITAATAVAIAESIESISNKEAKIKWVNDIYCNNKKVCGILTEASFNFESGIIDHAVLGIGINVKPPKGGFSEEIKDIASSIFDDNNFPSADIRNKLVAEILNRFWNYYKNIDDKSFLESYKSRSLLINKEVNLISNKTSEKALVIGIDDECRLKVKLKDGSVKLLSSGEVSIKI